MTNINLSTFVTSVATFAAKPFPNLNQKIDADTWNAEENGWPRGANGRRGLASTPTKQESEYLEDRYIDYQIDKANARLERQFIEAGKASREIKGAWEGAKQEISEQAHDAATILATGAAVLLSPISADAEEYRDQVGFAMMDTLLSFFEKKTYTHVAVQGEKAARQASKLGDRQGAKIRTIAVLSVVSPLGWIGRAKKAAKVAKIAKNLADEAEQVGRKNIPEIPSSTPSSREREIALRPGEGNADPTDQLNRRLNPLIDKLEDGERDVEVIRNDLQEIAGDLTPNVFAPHVKFADSGYSRATIYRDPEGRFEILALGWKPGQGTVPHDHGGSRGVDLVISGQGKEIRYHLDPRGVLKPFEEIPLLAGVVHAIEDSLIHTVLNPGISNMISLHVYFPAMDPSKIKKF